MMHDQALQMDIEYWLEEMGYEAMIDAVRSACLFWAEEEDETCETRPRTIEPSTALWAKRAQALLMMFHETRS